LLPFGVETKPTVRLEFLTIWPAAIDAAYQGPGMMLFGYIRPGRAAALVFELQWWLSAMQSD
jgi:hypothetical protein